MISAEEATEIILTHRINPSIIAVPLNKALKRVPAENLIADRDFPPYDRITMDGIAINYASFKLGRRKFSIENICSAGKQQITLYNINACIEVMTGAILPKNTDTVIPYEDIRIKNGIASIQKIPIKIGQNIHRKGKDCNKRNIILPKREKMISPAEISITAAIGKTHMSVFQLPKAMIISTGDELVEIDKEPLTHQIRKSNVYHIQATFESWNIETDILHLPDDLLVIKKKLANVLTDYKIVIISGGISKGKFDYIHKALEDLGVKKLFYKIKQRPGKPFWFGKAENGTLVFAFPGNPVSSFLCLYRYFIVWMKASLGFKNRDYPFAVLNENVEFMPDLTYFLQVKIYYNKFGEIIAKPVMGHGSGDMINLINTDGFLELPKGKNFYKKGESYPFISYR